MRRFPIYDDLPLIRNVGAVDDLHSRRFACSVLPRKAIDLPAGQFEINIIQHPDCAETLSYMS